jgi:hypothetical protein
MKLERAIAGLAAFLAALPAAAQSEIIIRDFSVICATTGGQFCEPPFSVAVVTTAQRPDITVQYDVPLSHCSSVRLHLFVDGALVRSTGYLGWGGAQPPFDKLPLGTGVMRLRAVKPGLHVVSINAEGQVSGCNSRGVSRWRGDLRVLVRPAAPRARR